LLAGLSWFMLPAVTAAIRVRTAAPQDQPAAKVNEAS
jgi:hypothetical protein